MLIMSFFFFGDYKILVDLNSNFPGCFLFLFLVRFLLDYNLTPFGSENYYNKYFKVFLGKTCGCKLSSSNSINSKLSNSNGVNLIKTYFFTSFFFLP